MNSFGSLTSASAATLALILILMKMTVAVSTSDEIVEFPYCELYEHLKGGDKVGTCHINAEGKEITIWKDRICPNVRSDDLKFFLSLFIILAWGALVRTFLKVTKLNIPYTVILMLTGLILGLGSKLEVNIPLLTGKESFCSFWSGYTKIARIPPKIILYIFLPVLIFESAFNMKVHVFLKSAWQILTVALPGMLISTFTTAAISQLFMYSYHWTFPQACLFGSIISATDPVAVVAILRKLGISDTLSTMIEGESLLNDGIAIVLYEVFENIVQVQIGGKVKIGTIIKKFLAISFGGPLLGLIAAKIAATSLSLIFNDPIVEITITLVAAYSTYYFGETLGFSGVVAVVVLGISLNSDSTSFSPKAEAEVHHFWEMLGYLANTVLFVFVGVVISETAINHISFQDVIYLMELYICINLIRLLMLTVLMPFLSRIGYGLKWKEMLVMTWGGLRGAVGLCLALEIYRNKKLCLIEPNKLGPKILFHTAGIVILTLLINGTSTKLLLTILKLDEVSQGRILELHNAVKHITGAQMRALTVQKKVRFMADVNWDLVDQFTRISHPFEQKLIKRESIIAKAISAKLANDTKRFKNKVHAVIIFQAKEAQYMEDARLRLMKALRIFYWRQYAQGVLTESATQVLLQVTESIQDKERCLIRWEDFSNHWRVTGISNWVKKNIIVKFGFPDLSNFLNKPSNRFRQPFWWLATRYWFEGVIHCLVLINMIPLIFEVVYQFKNLADGRNPKRALAFLIVNILFTFLYTLLVVVKITAFGCGNYCTEKRNFIDVAISVASCSDVFLTLIYGQSQIGILIFILLVMRLGFRTIEIVRPWFPQIFKFIDNRTKQSLFLGYDIGTGFVSAVNDILKFLPQIAQHPRIFQKFKESLEYERLQTLKAMGKLQTEYPQIAIGVKTRQASRTVLNQMHETVNELKEDGLLDDKDSAVLENLIEERMKLVLSSPSSITPPSPESILEHVNWILGNKKLATYISKRAVLKGFSISDTIWSAGDPPDGIYVIISGMIKMHYMPLTEIVAATAICGQIPNKDFFIDLTFEEEEVDLFSTGTVIGELGVLTGQKVAATVTCETVVTAYHISFDDMQDALDTFNDRIDSLESRLWRSCGLRIAATLLPYESAFQAWTGNKIRMHLERSTVPIRPMCERFTIPDFISTVILIHGQIMDVQTRDLFIAPCVLPHTSTRLCQNEDCIVEGKLMLIAHEEIDYYKHESQRPCSSAHSEIKSAAQLRTEVNPFNLEKLQKPQQQTYNNQMVQVSTIRLDTRQRRLSIALNLRANKM